MYTINDLSCINALKLLPGVLVYYAATQDQNVLADERTVLILLILGMLALFVFYLGFKFQRNSLFDRNIWINGTGVFASCFPWRYSFHPSFSRCPTRGRGLVLMGRGLNGESYRSTLFLRVRKIATRPTRNMELHAAHDCMICSA
jgi:hypothetical protein